MDSLTGRELQVARLILGRRSNFEIRAELFLSGKTVETHVRNVGDRVGLVPRVPRRDPEHRESRPTA